MTNWDERQDIQKGKADDARNPYEVDYARVVHSASFRRLQGKTQILNLGDSDFYRTRLTHSMEVSQVATGILYRLRKEYGNSEFAGHLPSITLLQTICLVHDLGHSPFGHGGEVALNFCMRKEGGFEGNGQTLRILSKLEKFSDNFGSNLTRRTLLGTLKYPVPYSKALKEKPELEKQDKSEYIIENGNNQMINKTKSGGYLLDRKESTPPKCYLDSEQEVVDWILRDLSKSDKKAFSALKDETEGKHRKTKYKSLDCSIMDLADDISYGVHDLEDAIAIGLVSLKMFLEDIKEESTTHFMNDLKVRYPQEFDDLTFKDFASELFREGNIRKRQISRLVHYFITNTKMDERKATFEEPLLRLNVTMGKEARAFLDSLQDFVLKYVIKSPNVQHLEFKGQQMVIKVFDALAHDPDNFLPVNTYKTYEAEGKNIRVICDHIAGMTDHFLLRTYERLFSPRMGSVFDRL